MIKIKEFFCKNAKVGSLLDGGIYTFGFHKSCAEGRVLILDDYRLKMSGSYAIDETVEGRRIKGSGTFEGTLYFDQAKNKWYAQGKIDGSYKGSDTIEMTYRFEEDYHVFEGSVDNLHIKVQTWNDSDQDFYLYAEVTPMAESLPSLYIKLK
jgi:hypothetical protein